MPEGDTIFRAARALNLALAGKIVTGFRAAIATVASVADSKIIPGRTVVRVEARGKWCLLHLSAHDKHNAPGELQSQGKDDPLILVSHMLMSGSWHIYRTGERWRVPRSSVRCELAVADFVALAVNVPVLEFHTERSLLRSSQVPQLGVDILGDSFSPAAGLRALFEFATRQPEAEVGVTLLNQRVMAGLGNVYKSEVAFAAGVNPFRQLCTVTAREFETMAEVSGRYMRANVANGASTGGDSIVTYSGNRRTTHAMDRSERLWVYGRQGQECRRCGALVMMRKQGEQARSTYWCPVCQPWLPSPGQLAPNGLIPEAPVGRTVKLLGGRRRVGC